MTSPRTPSASRTPGGRPGRPSRLSSRPATRRTTLLALPAAAVSAAAMSALRSSPAVAAPGVQQVQLAADPGSVVRRAEVALGSATRGRTEDGDPVLGRVEADRFGLVALTWSGDASPDLEIRVRRGGAWQSWTPVRPMHDGPTGGNREARSGRRGSDLAWVRSADAVQVRQRSGRAPRDLRVVLIDPGRRAGDSAALPAREQRAARRVAKGKPYRPPMRGRKSWGADERLRDGRPSFCNRLQQVHLHHTVNSNDYTKAEVPALIRGMYSYHTRSLGWSDIGYNFLVDRFGRIWVGRAGGPDNLVRGAHTLGFNHTSTGIAVIGNMEAAAPTDRTVTAIVMLAAWKLRRAGKRPQGRAKVRSEGSDRFGPGANVWLPTIDGHRDTNDTACPGSKLYARLPDIRRRAQRRWARG